MSDESLDDLLRRGKMAANNNDVVLARRLLSQVIQRDPRNETAWLWLSGVVETPERMRYCLQKVLALNPDNDHAQAAMRDFDALAPRSTPEHAVPLKPGGQSGAADEPAESIMQRATRRVVGPRPASMVEGGAVQAVVTQHTRVMWGYAALWSGLTALNLLLFRSGQLAGLGFGLAAGRALAAALLLLLVQMPAWWLLVNLLERQARHQSLGRTAVHATLSAALWPSSLAILCALLVGGAGIYGGVEWSSVGLLGRLIGLGLALIWLFNGVVRTLAEARIDRREVSRQLSQALLAWGVVLAVGLWVGWRFTAGLIGA